MSKIEIIKTFNDLVESFLVQYSQYLGTTYHHYFTKLVKINFLLPIQHFIYYENKYKLKDFILARNKEYFNNFDVLNNIKNTECLSDDDNSFMDIIRLNGVYDTLTKEEQEGTWDYFQAMLEYSLKYLEIELKLK
jgi:hypothetical protein